MVVSHYSLAREPRMGIISKLEAQHGMAATYNLESKDRCYQLAWNAIRQWELTIWIRSLDSKTWHLLLESQARSQGWA
jgi:hypothetical protein